MTDPIADLLTRIRNAQLIRQPEVVVPYSKFKYALAQIMEKEGWLTGLAVIDQGANLKILLKYDGREPVIGKLHRVSKPGRRVYVSQREVKRVLNGLGTAIISTSRGLMTDQEARRAKLGGEVVCEIS